MTGAHRILRRSAPRRRGPFDTLSGHSIVSHRADLRGADGKDLGSAEGGDGEQATGF